MASLKERFMRRVDISGDCWAWQGAITNGGYGLCRDGDQKTQTAHRVSYEIFTGAVPEGMDVMHACDNRCCVNPAHLSVGTRAQNMQDAKRKGRTARGERHGRRKLTAEQAEQIKHAEGTQTVIAKRFGISQTHVHQIKSGKNWA